MAEKKNKPSKKGRIIPSTKKRNYPKQNISAEAEKKAFAYVSESKNPPSRVDLKPGALLSPLPAVMVTVGDMEKPNIITIGWCGILSTDPARAYISVRPSRYSHKLLSENREFVMNITTEELAEATDYAGIYTGAKVDKFKVTGLTPVKSRLVAPPTIAESPLALECRVFQVIESGTHDIFLADIVSVSCSENILDKGRICLDRAKLLAYAHGEYFTVGKRIGKFGFSTDKERRQKRADTKNREKKDKK
jgi:flavin reductase (DIM6/NTAB) family NADH-FMN oxidoreductase RutF